MNDVPTEGLARRLEAVERRLERLERQDPGSPAPDPGGLHRRPDRAGPKLSPPEPLATEIYYIVTRFILSTAASPWTRPEADTTGCRKSGKLGMLAGIVG